MTTFQTIGCHECAYGKVLGCWRCGSRITAHQYACQLCENFEREVLRPITKLVYGDYEPHCLMAWEQMAAGMDETAGILPRET